jgi:hypothetical protein
LDWLGVLLGGDSRPLARGDDPLAEGLSLRAFWNPWTPARILARAITDTQSGRQAAVSSLRRFPFTLVVNGGRRCKLQNILRGRAFFPSSRMEFPLS